MEITKRWSCDQSAHKKANANICHGDLTYGFRRGPYSKLPFELILIMTIAKWSDIVISYLENYKAIGKTYQQDKYTSPQSNAPVINR